MKLYTAPTLTWTSSLLSVVTMTLIFFSALFYALLVPLLLYLYSSRALFWLVCILAISTIWWHTILPLPAHYTWWRENRVFEAWRAYFELSVYAEDGSIPAASGGRDRTKTLYTFVPHGLFPFGLALVSGVLFKGENIPIAIASNLFYVPVFGLLLRLLGCVPADKDIFKTGGSVVLVPDGIAGAFYSDRQHERVFLRQRKGFVKHALAHGYDIVPVYCFGHTQLYDVYGFQELSRRLRFAFIFFWGKGWLPHARPISIVMGERVTPSTGDSVDPPAGGRGVDHLHNRYLVSLKSLYDKYKSIVPEWDANKELDIV